MEFWLDSVNEWEVRTAASWGVLSALSLNPVKLQQMGMRATDLWQSLSGQFVGKWVVSTTHLDAESILEEMLPLSEQIPQLLVKLPMSLEGLKAVERFCQLGVETEVTLVYSEAQALLAARAGATYVSVLLGRMEDIGMDGVRLLGSITELFQKQQLHARVLASSVRHPRHVIHAVAAGAKAVLCSFEVLQKMAYHPLTEGEIERFLIEWSTVSKI
ncbi:transaldolase family protein [Alicyclobacillus tolerans]|uniref:Transaldolase n=2 Tax=Alicyclobacillus tolerans TaxID=90970 RepID=A0A1M6VRA0_9BACL|nr:MULTISPECIES: transaldolase family protein [Alicyclobacillus]MDP9727786.1 transaldolase [Alicyclobacillus tengchongensis]QRF24461.1 fructose-6-phosphate aldolase [Alicyclobacillus sp. TC]SHK83884.1 transaldolase [Alicyclobacillus montanus]